MKGNNGKPTVIPMRVPNVGQPQQQQQIQFNPAEATIQLCEKHPCTSVYFDRAFKMGIISPLNPRNPTGRDLPVIIPVFVCRSCGYEYGQSVVMSDGKAD